MHEGLAVAPPEGQERSNEKAHFKAGEEARQLASQPLCWGVWFLC